MSSEQIRRGWSPVPEAPDAKPWYRQFWPWFIIALPLASVVGGITTIFISLQDPDGLVADDYYRAGLAINRTMEREQRARELGLSAQLSLDSVTGDVVLNLPGVHSEALQLDLSHSTRASADRELGLKSLGGGRYGAALGEPLPPGDWKLRVEDPGGQWRLTGRMNVALEPRDRLQARLEP